MKVLILLSFAAVTLATRECGENSHYESCGTACPLTCKNYNNPPKVCVLMCNPGCHCDEGYVKTADGRCVAPEECPAQTDLSSLECGENAHYEECGTACPLTCKNYMNPPKFCVMMCKTGCHCDKGYVKTDDGRCVRPEECRAESELVCRENQVFNDCGTACPLTCDNYQNPPKTCDMEDWCIVGCECAKGFVKTRDGRCVRPEECPASGDKPLIPEKCGENQILNTCGTTCPLTCDNYQNPPKICTLQCVIGCACEKGFVKTRDGRCVRREECPSSALGLGDSMSDVCDLQSEAGLCDAYMPRFFYDSSRGECRRFVYGGCGGNGNNFKTIEECRSACE